MRVRDLGPMVIDRDDGPIPCARGRQAAILSMLAFHANRRVSIDELVVATWGYDAVVSRASVENHIWRLRKLLDPTYSKSSSSPLRNEGTGYRLMLPPDDLDSSRFASLAERSRSVGDATEVVESCDAALALWRGSPYEVIAHVSETAAGIAAFEQLRGEIAERRIDALLALDRVDQALADVDRLIGSYPFREHLWAQRMAGLARRGRTDDALRTFQRLRRTMLDELGLGPGREVTQLHQAILSGGEVGDSPAGSGRPHTARRGTATGLPRTSALLGRDAEVVALLAALRPDTAVTVVGAGGTGKTRLVIEVARSAVDRFPDGVYYVDLTQVTAPDQVAAAAVTTVGLSAGTTPLSMLSDHLLERRALIVLDNCEHVLDGAAELVHGLVGVGSMSTVLATSREPLNVDTEQCFPLGPLGLTPDPDRPHSTSTAAAFFLTRAATVDPDATDVSTVETICAALDGLPLALELAAARTRSFHLREIAQQVADDPTRLARVGRGPADHHGSLSAAIDWSYELLSPLEQVVYCRLSVLPGPFTLPVATAVVQSDGVEVDDVPTSLASLVHRSMLIRIAGDTTAGSSSFRQLDTVRAHARHALDKTGQADSTIKRRDAWVLRLLRQRPRSGSPEETAWYDALDTSYPAVRATLQGLLTGPLDLEILQGAAGLGYYWYYRVRMVEGRGWLSAVVDRFAEAWPDGREPTPATLARLTLAATMLITGQFEEARAQLSQAVPHLTDLPVETLPLAGHILDTVAGASWSNKQFDVTQAVAGHLTAIVDRVPDDAFLALKLDRIRCIADMVTRPFDETIVWAEQVYDRSVLAEDLLGQWQASGILQIMGELTGDPGLGGRWCDRLIRTHLRLGHGGGPAFLEGLAIFAAMQSDFGDAARLFSAAQAEGRRVGMPWPNQLRSEEFLTLTRDSMEPVDFQQSWTDGEPLTLLDVARERRLLTP